MNNWLPKNVIWLEYPLLILMTGLSLIVLDLKFTFEKSYFREK